MKRLPYYLLITVLCSFNPVCAQSFSDVYRDFKRAVDQNQPRQALQFSEQALRLGTAKYGEKSDEVAMLTVTHGNMLLLNQRYESAFDYYLDAEALYDERYGDDSVEYTEALVTILENLDGHRANLSPMEKAHQDNLLKKLVMALADDDLAQATYAGVYHRSALVITAVGRVPVSRGTLSHFADNALASVGHAYGEDDLRTTETRYVAAMIYHGANKRKAAIKHYEQVIEWVDGQTDFSHPYVLSSHAKLVALYEQEGQSDKATAHCVAIGSMTPWSDEQKPEPLFRQRPQYPDMARGQSHEGSALLTFDIDEQGFVNNIEITDVTGGIRYGHAAKRALERWRYAPKFEQGQAVVARGNKVRLDFRLE